MKEVVQGLGVTADTMTGVEIKITIEILVNSWCKIKQSVLDKVPVYDAI